MALYQHRQSGSLIRLGFVFGSAVVVLAILLAPESRYATFPAFALTALGAWLFGSLSVWRPRSGRRVARPTGRDPTAFALLALVAAFGRPNLLREMDHRRSTS